MAASARAVLLSRFNVLDLYRLSLKPRNLIRPLSLPTSTATIHRRDSQRNSSPPSSPSILNCLVSGVDGGGVADDFISTRKTTFGHEFSALADMLKQIEPLDTSVIAKGVSDPAKDSMKRTISTMLGLLPSDQFSVTVRVTRRPLNRLLVSSIITGYTLWNAEYRLSLMRNFDVSLGSSISSVSNGGHDVAGNECKEREDGDVVDGDICSKDDERTVPQSIGYCSAEALIYIEELKSELATVERELNAQKLENKHLECKGEENNDLLEYLRSLEPDMVTELSQPSSLEVEEIIQHLVQNILQRFFKEDNASGFLECSLVEKSGDFLDNDLEHLDAAETSRDYLAKLLFWCMLLGHHMRGLEYRLHLSCIVGLL